MGEYSIDCSNARITTPFGAINHPKSGYRGMRPRVPHMNELDDSILEFFEAMGEPGGERVALSPTPVWYNLAVIRGMTDKKQNTFSNRMNQMTETDLLEKVDDSRGYYRITPKGRAYLEGNLEAEDLELED